MIMNSKSFKRFGILYSGTRFNFVFSDYHICFLPSLPIFVLPVSSLYIPSLQPIFRTSKVVFIGIFGNTDT